VFNGFLKPFSKPSRGVYRDIQEALKAIVNSWVKTIATEYMKRFWRNLLKFSSTFLKVNRHCQPH
jgi:hypothetical protein